MQPDKPQMRENLLGQVLAEVERGSRSPVARLKREVRRLAHRTGLVTAMARASRSGAHVVMYHKVERRPESVFGAAALDVPTFAKHLEFLTRHYEVMPLPRLAAELKKGQVPHRAVAVTFDDGYRNNLILAYPLLERYRVPATVYVTAGLIGTSQWMWPSELAEMALRAGFPAVGDATGDRLLIALFHSELQPLTILNAATEYLLRVSPAHRTLVLERLRRLLHVEPDDENRFLSWDEVRTLKAGGIDIGAHTVTHPQLTQLDEPTARNELVAGRDRIEEELGERPTSFAYPHGVYDQRTRALASQYFQSAVTTRAGANDASSDPFELRRIAAYSVEDLSFELARPR